MELQIPKNMLAFEEQYKSDAACRTALLHARWPSGFICPKCGHAKGWQHSKRQLIECAGCGHQVSALAGTVLHGSKLSLKVLFRLLYFVVAEKSGTNRCAMSRQLGIDYDTATLWSRKLREVMVRQGRTKLDGTVEVDEFKLGGPAEGCNGRRLGKNQALVLVLVEENSPGVCGRLRMEHVADATEETLLPVIVEHVAKGSRLRTDGLKSYRKLDQQGFRHQAKILNNPKKAATELPLVHRVTSLFKRFVLGVLHGTWTTQWLQPLLDEFVFKFNRRSSLQRPLLFQRLIDEGMLRRSSTRKALQAKARIFAAVLAT